MVIRAIRKPLLSGTDLEGREFRVVIHPLQEGDRALSVVVAAQDEEGERVFLSQVELTPEEVRSALLQLVAAIEHFFPFDGSDDSERWGLRLL